MRRSLLLKGSVVFIIMAVLFSPVFLFAQETNDDAINPAETFATLFLCLSLMVSIFLFFLSITHRDSKSLMFSWAGSIVFVVISIVTYCMIFNLFGK